MFKKNMEKILISTKQSHHDGGSDAPGTSLMQLLFADYLQQNRNCQVYLSDPFYNSHNILMSVGDKVKLAIDFETGLFL